jgi:hypothetical protein
MGALAAPIIVFIALGLLIAGCGGTSAGSSRDKAVADFAGSGDPTTAYTATCDSTPSVGSNAYPCDLSHNFTDDGWYCVTFNAKNEVVNFERSYVDDMCG